MSISSAPAPVSHVSEGPYRLVPFDAATAPIVARWARTDAELFWLAPKTLPPLTCEKVLSWTAEEGCPLLLQRDGAVDPIGYLELNQMPGEPHHLWMGHCVLSPEARGTGVGKLMVRMLMTEGFRHRRARRLSLVVFPDNEAAIACYLSAGFVHAGEQTKYFYVTGRQHRMLRMTCDRHRFESLLAARSIA